MNSKNEKYEVLKVVKRNIEKFNLRMDDGIFTIFSVSGYKKGNSWVCNAIGCFIEQAPSPVKADIEEMIDNDIKAGNFEKISYVNLTPNYALCLYLEGALPLSCIEAAEATVNEVVFNEVNFDTSMGPVKLRVKVSEDAEVATMDKNGEVV